MSNYDHDQDLYDDDDDEQFCRTLPITKQGFSFA